MTEFGILFLEAVRICLYLWFMHLCLGEYRGGRRMTLAAFFVLWMAEGFLRSLSFTWREAMLTDLFFFTAEIPVLFLLSFCYKGSGFGRMGTALFLPTLYWALKWTVIEVFFRRKEVSDSLYFGATMVAVLLLFLFTVILGRMKKSRREQERERLEEEIRMYERQFDLIRRSGQAVRALKHDLKHHIKMLRDLVESGEQETTLAYLSSMGEFMKTAEEYVDSGNENIDAILNYMISRAKSENADVDWNICIPEQLPVPAFDINVVLSNLLENALQALLEAEKPVLSIRLIYDRKVLCIQIRNSTCARKRIPTNREGHGLGLSNVQRITDRYHGNLTISEKDGWFQADVLLFLP